MKSFAFATAAETFLVAAILTGVVVEYERRNKNGSRKTFIWRRQLLFSISAIL